MKSPMIRFSNKLELRYGFNDKSTYIDATIRHRCEKEILQLIRSLSDMLDVRLTVYDEPHIFQEGFKDIWCVAGESSSAPRSRSADSLSSSGPRATTSGCRRNSPVSAAT